MPQPAPFATDAWSSPALDNSGAPIFRDSPTLDGNTLTPAPGQPAATEVWAQITPLDATTPAFRFVCAQGAPWPTGRVY